MLGLRRSKNRKPFKTVNVQLNPQEVIPQESVPESINNNISAIGNSFEEYFSLHISNYIGHTVTVFVTSGGYVGSGFTGILYNVTTSFIQLIIKPGPAPSCPLGNKYLFAKDNYIGFNPLFLYNPFNHINWTISSVGAIASIPLNKIASFVHNSL